MHIRTLAACFVAAVLASPAHSQCRFEYITFDKIQLDPDYALGTSGRWGILVNTGDVPISVTQDWQGGLWYAESSRKLAL